MIFCNNSFIQRLQASNLFKDSFWAVFGNGLGNFLLLLAGIAIARFLGKDVYGEYGMVKTTMFYIAAFSTFGLGYTATKFIAEYKDKDSSLLKSITLASIKITLCTSVLLALLLLVFSEDLAKYINAPQLSLAFRFLAIIIVFRALSTTGAGLLGGFKAYKKLGINNIISGFVMICLAVPFTYYFGLLGSLSALCLSQMLLAVLNIRQVQRIVHELKNQTSISFMKRLLSFSTPVAMQELTYALCNWGVNLLIAKYASLGELGIYSACAQWNAIVLFVPGLLSNVVLSYLSGTKGDSQQNLFKKVMFINLLCAVIPFLLVFTCSPLIESFYGQTFKGVKVVLNVLIFSCIFNVLSSVYSSYYIADGRNWSLFILRVCRDFVSIIALYVILQITHGHNAALNYSILIVGIDVLFLLLLVVLDKVIYTNSQRKVCV